MREFQGRRTLKRVLYSRLFVLLLLGLVLFLAHSVYRIWQRSRVVVADRNELAAQVAALVDRKQALERELAALQTDRGVEEAIRQKFSVVKEGEGVVTVVASTSATTTVATTSWWQALWPL